MSWLIWALVGASVVTWGLRFAVRPLPVPAQAAPVDLQRAAQGDVARLLGAGAAAPAPVPAVVVAPAPGSDRIKLIGLMAPAHEGARAAQGLALLALDGQPPRTYRVGASIDGAWVLQAVDRRSVSIGPPGAPAAVVLEMPALPVAATGVLPRPGAPAATPAGAAPPATPVAVPQVMAPPPVVPQPNGEDGLRPMPPPGTAGQDGNAFPAEGITPQSIDDGAANAVRMPPDRLQRRQLQGGRGGEAVR